MEKLQYKKLLFSQRLDLSKEVDSRFEYHDKKFSDNCKLVRDSLGVITMLQSLGYRIVKNKDL